uniref:transcription activator GLK1-like n=1 Tax=Erigeron canadensis TaxID=72917 RepID=UPI001CB8A411|nr:transcription activator GLK1-like [Erigeron canadensis]
MLAVMSPLGNNNNTNTNTNKTSRDERCEMIGFSVGEVEFPDFSDDNLIESIDFDDLFVGMDEGAADMMLPDLEMDPELLASAAGDFSLSGDGEDSNSSNHQFNNNTSVDSVSVYGVDEYISTKQEQVAAAAEDVNIRDGSSCRNNNPSRKDTDETDIGGGRKSSSTSSKNNSSQGKRKVKVDWTPELHRRFVQAVEQLGVDKAVPSRILEIMGIGCLTRHNIASHLQKYRSHRKHLLAREAEAASWSQRRQMYTPTTARTTTGGGGKGNWVAPITPTMGFPPHYRPLHVWGHPSMDRPLMPMWSKHTPNSPHVWPPTWHPHHQRPPYLPQILPQTRFPSSHVQVPCIPPSHSMYKTDTNISVSTPSTGQSCPQPVLDLHPSTETIDDAIGEILSKPWQPLPLGLKPPALDSVMVELQRQGIQKVPPPTCF